MADQQARRSRRQRVPRLTERQLIAILLGALVSLAVIVAWLSPSEAEKPLMSLYIPSGCEACERYAQYLRARGFRVNVKSDGGLETLRTAFSAPPSLRSSQIGVVDGLFVEGHVPAAEIHKVLARRHIDGAVGLIVPGRPPGAPGVNAAFPEPFTVFVVRAGGIAQPVRTYNHREHLF